MKRTTVLIVLDGWGIGGHDYSNPLFINKPKNIQRLKLDYPYGTLQSYGIAVGLPWDEEGNSEVGHLNLGAGKIIYQHFPKITLSIQSGEFFKNPILLQAFAHAKQNQSAVHLAGLLTAGNVHASLDHVRALISLAKKSECRELYIHFFADGKDSPPKSVLNLLQKAGALIKEFGTGEIASISGRYYALDRDEHWDRTEKTYATLTGQTELIKNFEEKIAACYDRGLTDEFIEPMLIGSASHGIKDGDALIFFDFREDSIRQISGSFILKDFDKFQRRNFTNLFIATMTHYSDQFRAPVIFPNETIKNPLGKVLSDNNLLQLRVAETEKYAHVTFFFNGYREKPYPNEYRVLVNSKKVAHYEDAPEMMTPEISTRIIEAVTENEFDFILANFASPDMIAHTGNYDAALQTIKIVDAEIGKMTDVCLERNATLIITSDHGNIEKMLDPYTGRPETSHDPNPVPLHVVTRGMERKKSDAEVESIESNPVGILSDVAPTVLALMSLKKPEEMTGQNLIQYLK